MSLTHMVFKVVFFSAMQKVLIIRQVEKKVTKFSQKNPSRSIPAIYIQVLLVRLNPTLKRVFF